MNRFCIVQEISSFSDCLVLFHILIIRWIVEYTMFSPDIELKIRAHNQLVGRLIGRGGATIKKIMEETGAHIYVSKLVFIYHL